jgi:hypothetical protein
MSYGDTFVLTLLTNAPLLAANADLAGIDRIGVDIEHIGKKLRQEHITSWVSDHSVSDLPLSRPVTTRAALFARCNPINQGSAEEIRGLLDSGVSVIMLPYFKCVQEVETFVRMVDDRAITVLLVETKEAAAVMTDLCRIDGVKEIHIGLNDMGLSLGWFSPFQVLISDFLMRLCEPVLDAGLRLGVGKVGRVGDYTLPIPSDSVIAQLPRLGASAALISRCFFNNAASIDLSHEITALRQRLDFFASQTKSLQESERTALKNKLHENLYNRENRKKGVTERKGLGLAVTHFVSSANVP